MMLEEFIRNDDVPLRRALAYALTFDVSRWPEELRPSVRRMITLCAHHSDEWLRTTSQRKTAAPVQECQWTWPLLWG